MIREIYIQLGSEIINYPLLRYCDKNADFLEEHGVLHPDFVGTLDDCPYQLSRSKYTTDACFYTVENKPYYVPDFSEFLEKLGKQLEAQPHIHTLCFFVILPIKLEYILPNILYLKEFFEHANIHIQYIQIPKDMVLENLWMRRIMSASVNRALSNVSRRVLQRRDYEQEKEQIRDVLSRAIKQDIPIVQIQNEQEIFALWSKWVNLPDESSNDGHMHFLPSPMVLAFIESIQKPHCAWYSQDNFIHFDSEPGLRNSYMRSYLRDKLRGQTNENFSENIGSNGVQDIKMKDCSEISLRISFENSKILAALLTPEFRQELLADFDLIQLQEQALPTRIAYAGLLFVENMCSQEELNSLCHESWGSLLPPKPCMHIGECSPISTVTVYTMTYNHEEFIEENIKGILEQKTNFPVTHLIVDDNSSDGTQDIIRKYASMYPHITPVFRKETNAIGSVQQAFNSISSPYVSVCDGDDYFCRTDKLQTQVDLLEKNPQYGLCFHPVVIEYTDYPNIKKIYPPTEHFPKGKRSWYYLTDLLRHNLIQSSSVMYRWRFAKGTPAWFDSTLTPSDWYWHLLHAEHGKIGFLPEVMSVYRRHPKSMFYQTETSTPKHRLNFGIQEIEMYEQLDIHFKGKYRSLISSLEKNVFIDLASHEVESDDGKIKSKEVFFVLCQRFPEAAKEFLQYVDKIKNEHRIEV